MKHLTLVEPNALFHGRLRAEVAHLELPADRVDIVGSSGASLPMIAAESTDAVVLMLTLCSVPNVEAVVHEAWRILKKGGRLFFLEHVCPPRSDTAGTMQRLLLSYTGIWYLCGDGCQVKNITRAVLRGRLPPLMPSQLCHSPHTIDSPHNKPPLSTQMCVFIMCAACAARSRYGQDGAVCASLERCRGNNIRNARGSAGVSTISQHGRAVQVVLQCYRCYGYPRTNRNLTS